MKKNDSFESLIEQAYKVIKKGGIVAIPFENLYGLATPALSKKAVNRVVELKNRDKDKPIPVIIPDSNYLYKIADKISPLIEFIINSFWPGPLTVILEGKKSLPASLLKDGKIGVRVPGECPAFELVKRFNEVITATSANLSNQPPLCSSDEIKKQWNDSVDFVWPGSISSGAPSTVITFEGDNVKIVREGMISGDLLIKKTKEFKTNKI